MGFFFFFIPCLGQIETGKSLRLTDLQQGAMFEQDVVLLEICF